MNKETLRFIALIAMAAAVIGFAKLSKGEHSGLQRRATSELTALNSTQVASIDICEVDRRSNKGVVHKIIDPAQIAEIISSLNRAVSYNANHPGYVRDYHVTLYLSYRVMELKVHVTSNNGVLIVNNRFNSREDSLGDILYKLTR